MELCADVVVVLADLTVGWVDFGFCWSAKSCTCRGQIELTWCLFIIRGLGNFGLVGISGVLGRWWWTAVSRDVIEDRSELIDDSVALCKKSSFFQRDPSACRGPSARGGRFKVTGLC